MYQSEYMYIYIFVFSLPDSNISISKLNPNHTGKYECTLNATGGLRVQTIFLTIISNKTKFCPVEGNYFFPLVLINGH